MSEHPDLPVDREQLQARLDQQALLADLGRQALEETDFATLLAEATRLTALGMKVRYCKVLEYQPARNCFLVRAGVGWHDGVVGHATIGADLGSPAGYALRTGKPVISNNLPDEDRFHTPALLFEHGVRRAINVILLGEQTPYGVLEVDSETPGVFTEHDVAFLQAMANLLGLALKRRQAEDELRHVNETLEQRVATEVAERRLAEDALRQAQKMEAIGKLTGGVAHDFNNLLQIITGNLELIGRAVSGDERLAHYMATALKGATRGARLTGQLLAFARRQRLQPEIRPINALIGEFDVLATRMLGETVEVTFDLAPDAGACEIDPAQFGSALLNLAANARDAMPGGGNLTVRSANLAIDAATAARHAGDARPGKYVMVELADAGTGMSPDVLARATEPFFTTKETGHGTGLGLSQVYGFVRQSGGFLTIQSTPGTGTTIRIHLPEVVADTPKPEPQADPRTGSGLIMVVDDDVDVRDLVALQLEHLGYASVRAASGPEALAMLRAPDPPAVDLLLTDVVMPGGINGVALVREARRLRPDLRALLMSGYMADSVPDASEVADLALLSKPYDQADLARAVKQALDQTRPRND